MDVKEFANKVPMAKPGFTVLSPKQETAYDKMIREKQMSVCAGCGGERPAYPAPQNVHSETTGKKNGKR
jgi:hypothetical protein